MTRVSIAAWFLAIACGETPELQGTLSTPTDPAGATVPDPGPTPDPKRPLEDLSELLEAVLEGTGAPAVTAGIVDEQGLYALGATGVRRNDELDAVTLADRWHLGSNTKAMTAALVGTYVDEGQVSFDSTLSELFPNVAVDPGWDGVTIADLLRHRAGVGDIPYDTTLTWFAGGDVRTLRADYVEQILTVPPFQPVGDYFYSNGGYVIAGAALERISGDSWESLMQSRLFEPLGMTDCGFGPPDDDHPTGHDASGLPQPGVDNPPALGPAGTVHCTMQSWAKFAHANTVGPKAGAPLLEADTWRALQDAPSGGYALGWEVTERPWAGGTVVHHVGSNTMWWAWLWVAPEVERAYFAVTNSGNPDHLVTVADTAIGELIGYDQRVP